MRTLRRIKVWIIIAVVALSAVDGWPESQKPGADAARKPVPESLESRMELILEFDALVAQYLDLLFDQKMPDVAMVEWCEKAEMRAIGYPRIQQAFGNLYTSIKSFIKGEARKSRLTLQQALWIMASERFEVIQSASRHNAPNLSRPPGLPQNIVLQDQASEPERAAPRP